MTSYDFNGADRFTVGTIGEVGARTFLLQAVQGGRRLTVKVEKQQIAILATYLSRAIEDLGRPGHLPEELELQLSPDDVIDFVAGNLSVSIDEGAGQVQVLIEEVGEGEGDTASITVTREQAAAFAIRATSLVEAGRPPCPLCGFPLDPAGHDCPRTNGHHAPLT
jgi:uncharacterized repeat protein (TIGR03847 family)